MKPKLFSLLAAGVFALGIGATQAAAPLTCSQACRIYQQHCLDQGLPALECRQQYLECMYECQG